jgi:hypothetical protein
MDILLGITGVFASILGLVLAFYAVFVNGRANKEILKEVHKGTIEIQKSAERQGEMLERIGQTQKYIAELVKTEGEKTRSIISH